MTVKAIIRPRTKARLARYVANITQGSDLGDFNGFTPASYDGDTSSTTDGDEQHPIDSDLQYRRLSGSWRLSGRADGTIHEAEPGVFTDPTLPVTGFPLKSPTTGYIYEYDGGFGRAEAPVLLLAGEVTGLQFGEWIGDSVTLAQSSGSGAQNGASWRMTCGANQHYVAWMDLNWDAGTQDLSDLIAAVCLADFDIVGSTTSTDFAAAVGLLIHTGSVDLTSGVLAGDDPTDVTFSDANVTYVAAGVSDSNVFALYSNGGTTLVSGDALTVAGGSGYGFLRDIGRDNAGPERLIRAEASGSANGSAGTDYANRGANLSRPTGQHRPRLFVALHELSGSGGAVVDLKSIMATVASR